MRKRAGIILFSIVLLCVAGPAQSAVYELNGHYYQFVLGTLSWTNANSAAASLTDNGLSWHLATINSAEENAFLVAKLQEELGVSTSQDLWIGGYQTTSASEKALNLNWAWVTGEPWSYTNWGVNKNFPEPNDCPGCGEENDQENYLGFAYNRYDYLGQWHDTVDDWRAQGWGPSGNTGYIAEAAAPIPGAIWLLGGGISGLVLLRRKRAK